MSDVPIDEYSEAEEAVLCTNLEALLRDVHGGTFSASPLSVGLICTLHRRLFATVRGHNGKVRARGFGEEHPIIMGKRAPPRDKVPQLLESFLQKAEQRIARLERSSAAECIRVAVELHTGLVAMRPFHDGNKRTARALLDVVLVRLGFPGVVFSVPRADYVTATRAGMDGDHSILVDLVLVLLTDALPTN